MAENSFRLAPKEEAELCSSMDVTVSCDGTWLTRGHSSQYGVCTMIGSKSGKVIDTEVLLLNYKGCDLWKNKITTGSVKYRIYRVHGGAQRRMWNEP